MTEIEPTSLPQHPMRSPSYPQRVHIRERAQWQAILQEWTERIETARQELASGKSTPAKERLYVQMLGARDQVRDAVRRMPMEVGDLYEEDHHSLENAVAALERLFERWKSA